MKKWRAQCIVFCCILRYFVADSVFGDGYEIGMPPAKREEFDCAGSVSVSVVGYILAYSCLQMRK